MTDDIDQQSLASPLPRSPALADGVVVGFLVALLYAAVRPPLYQRDGFVYHLLGRDFIAGTNPHHLLWNAVEALVTHFGALFGTRSVLPFQLLGMACGVASAVLLHDLLCRVGARRSAAFAATLFVACTPWTWFMTFQNQPYALMFLLFIVFLRAFAAPDGEMPHRRRFAVAAAAAVGLVMLQQAAALIVVGAAVCFVCLSGWRRALDWAVATGAPTALLYVGFSMLQGVRSVPGFWQWATGYLRSQHSLQTRPADVLSKSAIGILGTFVNQEPFRDHAVDAWPAATIQWFYTAVGLAIAIATVAAVVTRRRSRYHAPSSLRPPLWVAVASIVTWAVFCVLWEPTNYYWFILLAPFFVCVLAQTTRPVRRTANVVLAAALLLATAWNVAENHWYNDAAGARRAPEPQLQTIARHLHSNDRLWVVDLGWSDDVDYDLLATTTAMEHTTSIASVADIVGRSRDSATWQRALEDSNAITLSRGGRIFLSDRVFDPDTFVRGWERSPFADYEVERPFAIDWPMLNRQLPAFVESRYDLVPSGFLIGSDTIWRLDPLHR